MIIDCISDLHGYKPELLGGDLLIVAGDLTARDDPSEWWEFAQWMMNQDYKKKIVIAGNHDNMFFKHWTEGVDPFVPFTYLCDSKTQFEGLKVWGTPWTSQFPGINPKCCAFTEPFMVSLDDKWQRIPEDIDILITHSPPHGFFDSVGTEYGAHVGDMPLREHVMKRIKPKLHVFGHIHEWGGKMIDTNVTKFVNASVVNERYKHVNKPVRIVL